MKTKEMASIISKSLVMDDETFRMVDKNRVEEIANYLLACGVTLPVRCKDCKWFNPEFNVCEFWHGARHPLHYCAEGRNKNE